MLKWVRSLGGGAARLLAAAAAVVAGGAAADPGRYATEVGIFYRQGEGWDDYARERCRLDFYHPLDVTGFSTVVWIHGGGLRSQDRFLPPELLEQGLGVVAVGYRLHPRVKAPAYVEDAAAAVAWTLDHLAEYGGDPDRVFISGHSAGCYLGDLVVMDKHYLAAYGHDANRLARNITLSAHKITHIT